MTFNHHESDVVDADRRQASRGAPSGTATIAIDGGVFEAAVENESKGGMFLVLDESLEVQVEVNDGEGRRSMRARVVRVTTLPGKASGWGLELIGESGDA